jgi:hypothetical protein
MSRCVEFPKERLKLGKQLGSGAFGRVLKAEATGNAGTADKGHLSLTRLNKATMYNFLISCFHFDNKKDAKAAVHLL